MRQYVEGDPIRTRADDRGHPQSFSWHGRLHQVETVEDIREPCLDWWSAGGEIHRVYYVVTTHRGMICEIYHDRSTDDWRISRIYD